MRVTIHDVANHAGVSAMTVSRVINDSPRVSVGTRKRVQASIAKLGYVPNRLARGLIQRRTGAFGVIVPDVANPFFTLVVRGAEDVAWRAGYHVILCDTQGNLERERGYLEDMVAFQVEGVLIAPVGDSSRPHLRVLTRNNVPFVLIDRSIAGFEGDLVQGDSVGENFIDPLRQRIARSLAIVAELHLEHFDPAIDQRVNVADVFFHLLDKLKRFIALDSHLCNAPLGLLQGVFDPCEFWFLLWHVSIISKFSTQEKSIKPGTSRIRPGKIDLCQRKPGFRGSPFRLPLKPKFPRAAAIADHDHTIVIVPDHGEHLEVGPPHIDSVG